MAKTSILTLSRAIPLQLWILCVSVVSSSTIDDSCGELRFVTREQWGSVSAESPANNITGPLEYVFIHHTAGSECTNQAKCSSVMRGIQNYHMNDRGWDDIGYSFLIGGDGKVYVGRGWGKEGAHTYGYNKVAYGISLMGNFMDHLPSDIMINAAKNLIACAVKQGYIVKDYGLYGHRDGRCTECPGDTFYPTLSTWENWHAKGPVQKFC